MNRGVPFLVIGVTFLSVALATHATDGSPASAATWLAVGLTLLGVGVGVSRATPAEPDDPELRDPKQA